MANSAYHELDKTYKIVFEDSSEGRISVAQRLYSLCNLLQKPSSTEPMKECYNRVKEVFVNDCKKKTKQSEKVCDTHLKNGIWHACQSVGKFYKDCKKYPYKGVSTVDLSAPWLWGVGGWLTGAIVAAAVWVLVYFVFLRKKTPKK